MNETTKTHARRQERQSPVPPEGYLPLREIAPHVSVDPSTLARWAQEGHVRAKKFRVNWYIAVEDVQHLADRDLSTLRANGFRPLREVEALTGVPRNTLSRWARDGRIEARKDGPRWQVNVEEVRSLSKTLAPGSPPLYEP